jgi:hypothetical protein
LTRSLELIRTIRRIRVIRVLVWQSSVTSGNQRRQG